MKDAVFTPQYVTEELLHLGVLVGCTSVLEPSAGSGAIISALRFNGFDWHITAVEIDSEWYPELYRSGPDRVIRGDFLQQESYFLKKYDLVVTSPPFSCIDDFIPHAYNFLNKKGKMAMLLRLQHLVGKKRDELFKKLPPTSVHLFGHRPAITHSVADIGGYAWVIWDNPLTKKPTTMHWIDSQVERVDGRVDNGHRSTVIQQNYRGRPRTLTDAESQKLDTELRKGRSKRDIEEEFGWKYSLIQSAERRLQRERSLIG